MFYQVFHNFILNISFKRLDFLDGIFIIPLVAQRLKRLPGMWETWVRSLGREDPLEKEMATHSSTLAWRIPWTEEPGRLQSMGSQRVGHDFTFTFKSIYFNGNTSLNFF